MSKIIKGVLVYAVIIAGISTILGMILFGAMYFTANSANPISMFGYRGISITNKSYENQTAITTTHEGYYKNGSHVKLIVNNGKFNVNIYQNTDSTSNIIVTKQDSITGIIKGEYNGSAEVINDKENQTVTVNLPEINGFVTLGKSQVNIILPSAQNFVYDIVLNSDSGKVVIDGEVVRKVQDQIVKSDELRIANLVATTEKALVKVRGLKYIDGNSADQKTHLLSATLQTKTGLFNFEDIENLKIFKVDSLVEKINQQRNIEEVETDQNIYKLAIERSGGEFVFNNLKSEVLMTGNNIVIKAKDIDTLKQGFRYESQKGFFKIDNIYSEPSLNDPTTLNYIETRNVSIDIKNITGPTEIRTRIGAVKVGNSKHALSITTKSSDITVSNAKELVLLTTQAGDITMNEFEAFATFITKNGNITATQKLPAGSDEALKAIGVVVQTESGKVLLNNIESKTKIDIFRNSNVVMNIAKNHKNREITHEINSNGGTVVVYTSAYEGFNIVLSEGATAKGQIGSSNIADMTKDKVGVSVSIQHGESVDPLYKITKGKVEFKPSAATPEQD